MAIRFPPASDIVLVFGKAVFRTRVTFLPTAATETAAPKLLVGLYTAATDDGADRRVEVTMASILSCQIWTEPDGTVLIVRD